MSGIEPGLPYDVLDGELVPWETPTRRGPTLQQRIDAARGLRDAYEAQEWALACWCPDCGAPPGVGCGRHQAALRPDHTFCGNSACTGRWSAGHRKRKRAERAARRRNRRRR